MSQDKYRWLYIPLSSVGIEKMANYLHLPKSFLKALVQIRNTMDCKAICIDGDLHLNYANMSFMGHNLGDDLNFPLIEFMTGRHAVASHYTLGRKKRKTVYCCIGSIIEACSAPNMVVWGAGLIEPPKKQLQAKRICAVRGPLTRLELLKQGFDCPEVFGDPALLFPKFYRPSVEKSQEIALIPHVTEEKNFVDEWRNAGKKVISFRNYGDWHQVIEQICSCKAIISTSLHGLILADAYGIPNIWGKFADVRQRNLFKYYDYYASQGIDRPQSILLHTVSTISLSKIDFSVNNNIDLSPLLTAAPFIK